MGTKVAPSYLRFRDSHHAIAAMFAAGWTISKVSNETGFSRRRLHIMLADPAYQDLIAEKAKKHEDKIDEATDQFQELHFGSTLLAARALNERLQDNADEMPVRELLAVVKDGADRFGYSAKTVRLNVNADFAVRLDQAIDRSAKVIEGTAQHPTLPSPVRSPRELDEKPAPSFIRALGR
jgi:hypothetical protein